MRNDRAVKGRKNHREPLKRFIVLALPFLSEVEFELMQGIEKGISTLGKKYELMIISGGYEAPLRKLAERGELAGAIGEFISPLWLQSLTSKGIPVIHLGSELDGQVDSVSFDLEEIASAAAATFVRNGSLSLAYLGPSGPLGASRLGEYFYKQALRYVVNFASSSDFSGPLLKGFLRALPLPTGVLCASDLIARRAIQAAQETGLSVPKDLAMIGLGNSRLESLHAGIPISSFQLPWREIGMHAGTLMTERIRESIGVKRKHLTIQALLHERESSIRSTNGLSRAMAYLRSNPSTDMMAGDLARFAGMSRRSFEIAVKKEFGSSPGVLLQETRRKRAEHLLCNTDLEISAISSECGYLEPTVFSNAFKRWTGQSPRDYRKSHCSV